MGHFWNIDRLNTSFDPDFAVEGGGLDDFHF